MSIYQNVKNTCRERGTTVNALETKLNFPRGSIFKWDKHTPSINKVKAVADVLNVKVDKLLQ